jgi:hypothetical protein
MLHVIEQLESLQRSIASLAPRAKGFSIGSVKVGHEGRWSGSLDIRVDAPSIKNIAMLLEVIASVRVSVANRLPDAGGLIAAKSWTADLSIQ